MKTFNFTQCIILAVLFIISNTSSVLAQCSGSEITGNASKFTIYNSIGNAGKALNAPDGNLTNDISTDDAIVLDLGQVVPPNNNITISMTRSSNSGRATIDASTDALNFYDAITNIGSTFTTNNIETVILTNTIPARFIRISRTAGKLKVDGVSYSFCADTDWDGIIDALEISNGSDHEDACSPNYLAKHYLDCDKDGVDNATESAADGENPCMPNGFSTLCDDDNDGVCNSYDNCPGTPAGEVVNSYGCPTSISCEYKPDGATPIFTPAKVWSATETIDARETPLVGDVTGDGIPDVVVDNYAETIFVLNGQTGATQYSIPVPLTDNKPLDQNNSANAIGNVDGDIYGEIFALRDDKTWVRFDFDGTNWTSTIAGGLADHNRYTPALADFDGDGNVELYSGSQIWRTAFDGTTNDLLLDGGIQVSDFGGSVAIDILDDSDCAGCAGLELVLSGRIFSVDIAAGIIKEERLISALDNKWTLGRSTSIADVDLDGDLDVIYTVASSNKSKLYIWDGQTNSLMLDYELAGDEDKVGRVNVADFDGDGFLEFGVHYGISGDLGEYIVVDDIISNLSARYLWKISTNDQSALTGSTVYDFDGDGAAEVVYRDETSLRILEGKDGSVKYMTPCSSPTRWEYPVIADVNLDGTTNIICTCGDINLSVFKSATDPWIPARSVWNQHAYNITNVNDDLTIPAVPDNNMTKGGGQFNNYLVQAVKLDPSGDPSTNATADATITNVIEDVYNCPTSGSLEVTVKNIGDKALSSSTELTVYDGDPEATNANILAVAMLGVNLEPNASHVMTITTSGCASADAFIIINDPGTAARPYDFTVDFPISGVSECDYTNNAFRVSNFLPIELSYFTAKKAGERVALNWETMTEINNEFFTIERSKDGNRWEEVVEVAGAGNSQEPLQYEAFDNEPYSGISYYRLKQTDFDGAYEYSQVEQVIFGQGAGIENVLVYPNPTKGILNLEIISNSNMNTSIQLTDIQGRSVLQQNVELEIGVQNQSMDMSQLPNGVYILSVLNNDHVVTTQVVKAQ